MLAPQKGHPLGLRALVKARKVGFAATPKINYVASVEGGNAGLLGSKSETPKDT